MKRIFVLFLVLCVSSTVFVYADSEKQMEIFFELLKAQKYTETRDFVEKWKKDNSNDNLEDKQGIEICEEILNKVDAEPNAEKKIAIASIETLKQFNKGMENINDLVEKNKQEVADLHKTSEELAKGLNETAEKIKNKQIKFAEPYSSSDPTDNLNAAIARSNAAKVEEFLSKGANVNQAGLMDYTPLMWACSVGNVDVIKLLIDHGAKLDSKNDSGETAIDIAKKSGHQEAVDFINKKISQ
jgi:hypothetical protein